MTTRIAIDPNVRVTGNWTYAGFEDIEGGPVAPGDRVRVWEPESQLSGFATIVEVDCDRDLVYIEVNWSALRTPTAIFVSCNSSTTNELRATWHHVAGVRPRTSGGVTVVP